jgi:hypothetical protein
MYMSRQQVLSLNVTALHEFVSRDVPEGLYLDYKRELSSGPNKDWKRELLKDITGFANSAGGVILLGIDEPDGRSVSDRMLGIENAAEVSRSIEQVTVASIDPPIAGLTVVPVATDDSRGCIAIYIPASFSRPHMVHHSGHRGFYARNSEAIFQMSTHEIREAVLSSVSAEDRARATARVHLARAQNSSVPGHGSFFLQAVPLLTRVEEIDALSPVVFEILMDETRRNKFPYIDLVCDQKPRPTIEGVRGMNERNLSKSTVSVHRTGYVSARVDVRHVDQSAGGEKFLIIFDATCQVFSAFATIINDLVRKAPVDMPYLMTAYYSGAGITRLIANAGGSERAFSYTESHDITWPEHFRNSGEDANVVAEMQARELFNAYGLPNVVK